MISDNEMSRRESVSLLMIAELMGNSPLIASRHYINLVSEDLAGDVEC